MSHLHLCPILIPSALPTGKLSIKFLMYLSNDSLCKYELK